MWKHIMKYNLNFPVANLKIINFEKVQAMAASIKEDTKMASEVAAAIEDWASSELAKQSDMIDKMSPKQLVVYINSHFRNAFNI